VGAEKILILRLSALGDVAQCLPALAALRAARPDAEIGWLVEDRHAGVLEAHPQLDRLFVWRRSAGALDAGWDVLRQIHAWGPDVALDLQGNLKSGLFLGLCGAPRRVGLGAEESREAAHLFATETVRPAGRREHRADRALRVVAALGAAPTAAVAPRVREDAVRRVRSALGAMAARTPFAALVPGTSAFGAFKRWPPERFGALAIRLREAREMESLVVHGPGQRTLADDVVAASRGAARLAPETTDVQELMALLAESSLVVGADSGPVVLASVLGVPTVVLFGPKDPAVYAPRGPRTVTVWKRVYCAPCRLRVCGDPICMTSLDVEEAWEGVRRLGVSA
jgi:lipopolysaccharide heptosyltransferase I